MKIFPFFPNKYRFLLHKKVVLQYSEHATYLPAESEPDAYM